MAETRLTLILLLLAVFVALASSDGHKKEKIIIHVPIKYHTIHHVKVQKIPIHIKKHVHHHKYHDVHKHHFDDDDGPYARFDGGHIEYSDESFY